MKVGELKIAQANTQHPGIFLNVFIRHANLTKMKVQKRMYWSLTNLQNYMLKLENGFFVRISAAGSYASWQSLMLITYNKKQLPSN